MMICRARETSVAHQQACRWERLGQESGYWGLICTEVNESSGRQMGKDTPWFNAVGKVISPQQPWSWRMNHGKGVWRQSTGQTLLSGQGGWEEGDGWGRGEARGTAS